jgi:ferredoxin-NADP reductase
MLLFTSFSQNKKGNTPAFRSKLIKKEEVAQGTFAFYFAKPEGFVCVPGQHITLHLTSPVKTDDDGNDRTLSPITIPSDNEVAIATRIRPTAFKDNLRDGEIGMDVQLIDPRGGMVLPKDASRPLVFLAGGIGITPFISMIREATQQKSEQKITFFILIAAKVVQLFCWS